MLDARYQQVNHRYLSGDNEHLSIDEKSLVKVRTPATEFSEEGYVGSLLADNGIVPVLQILREINQGNGFIECFKHLSPKHHKLKPTAETVLAGILGIGCNIGIDKLSQISVGLNDSTLKNTVTWCFTVKNVSLQRTAGLPQPIQSAKFEKHRQQRPALLIRFSEWIAFEQSLQVSFGFQAVDLSGFH